MKARYVATAAAAAAVVCVCGLQHRDVLPALHCVRRNLEQALIVRCVLRDAIAPWDLTVFESARSRCSFLGLSVERHIPSLWAQHVAAQAQQSLALPEPPLRSGHPVFMKARRYE